MKVLIESLTTDEVQDFIITNEHLDINKLLLGKKSIFGVPTTWIVNQIQGRRKAKEKLPIWYNTRGIVYPPSVNLEQCSSEVTAQWKSKQVNGNRGVDLTGGFGVDAYFVSRVVSTLEYVDPNLELLTIAQHNHLLLGATNIRYHNTTAENFLQISAETFDFLLVDPSRRMGDRKTFHLQDGQPDVVALRSALLKKAGVAIIKSSPLLDLKQAFRELKTVSKFMVVSSENECKELLIFLRSEVPEEPTIQAVDLNKEGTSTGITFKWSEEKNAVAKSAPPQFFLYEPNAAILKAGAFKFIAQTFGLGKLAPDTHLYTSTTLVSNFPGRVFKILEQAVALDKKLLKKFDGGYANIVRRNHPLTVEAIMKKTGLKEGGHQYLICTRTAKPVVLIAERLN